MWGAGDKNQYSNYFQSANPVINLTGPIPVTIINSLEQCLFKRLKVIKKEYLNFLLGKGIRLILIVN